MEGEAKYEVFQVFSVFMKTYFKQKPGSPLKFLSPAFGDYVRNTVKTAVNEDRCAYPEDGSWVA